MVKSLVERRMLLRGAGVAGATVVAATAVPAEASAHGDHHGILGAWRITRMNNPPDDTAPVAVVASFAAGGAFAVQDIAPLSPGGLGTWKAAGDRFEATFWTGNVADTPESAVTIRVHVRGRARGDHVRGTYRGTVFAGGTTTMVGTFSGTFTGSRVFA